MCQFHQMLIVHRYLTQNPDIEASQELLNLTNIIAKTDKESFFAGLSMNGMRNTGMSSMNVFTTKESSESRLHICDRNYAVHI